MLIISSVLLAHEHLADKFSVVNIRRCLSQANDSCFIEDIHEFEIVSDGDGWHAFIQSVQNYLGSFLIQAKKLCHLAYKLSAAFQKRHKFINCHLDAKLTASDHTVVN